MTLLQSNDINVFRKEINALFTELRINGTKNNSTQKKSGINLSRAWIEYTL